MSSAPDKPASKIIAEPTEKHWRSFAKAISWRCTGTVDTIVVSFLITGSAGKAVSIGLVEFGTKTFLYYFHERMWNRIQWGRVPPKPVEYEI